MSNKRKGFGEFREVKRGLTRCATETDWGAPAYGEAWENFHEMEH